MENNKKKNNQFKRKRYPTKQNKLLILIILFLVLIFLYKFDWKKDIYTINLSSKKRLKIGIVGVRHDSNVGNNLIKYAISIVLSNFGYEPYIIGKSLKKRKIAFVNKNTNLVIIKNNFNEIKENDYDILMVNSDQTWRKSRKNDHFLDYGFLRFAKDWNIKKFVYGASIGYDFWSFSQEEDRVMKELLKNFTGISVREKGSIKLIKEHLGITPEFVLDPTLLIDKQYYLNLIKDYKNNNDYKNNDYIFMYTFRNIKTSEPKIKTLYKELIQKGIKIYEFNLQSNQTIEDFLYYISNCKAVLTESFHGTIFSIIFNKPFITISSKHLPQERFKSLGKLLGIEKRIIYYYQSPNINLIRTPLNINYSLIKELRDKSINFIKKNLEKDNP